MNPHDPSQQRITRTDSRLKRFGLPAALVVGGVTIGGMVAPIGLVSAQESDADSTESDSTESESTDSTGADEAEASDDEEKDGRRGRKGRRGAKLDAVTESLGLSRDELRQGFADGKSLAQQAEEQGVDVEDLRSDLIDAANERLDQAVADGKIDEAAADEKRAAVEERIDEFIEKDPSEFEGRKGRHGRGYGARFGAGEEVAEVLGLTTDELREGLRSGKSLTDLAEEQGVPVDDVAATLTAGMEERVADAVEEGKIDDEKAAEIEARFSEKLDDILNGEARPGRGHRGDHRNDGTSGGGTEEGDVEETSFSA